MSKRSYSACYLHFVWGTKKHYPLLSNTETRKKLYHFFRQYLKEKEIFLIAIYINPEHIHLLIDLPTNITIEDVIKLTKGGSSHWINQNDLTKLKFAWATGYGVFSVSKSNLERVKRYIENQEEHHKRKTFLDEYREFVHKYGMEFREEQPL